jgi:hypothetical protein
MLEIGEVHRVPGNLIVHVVRRARDATDELLHDPAAGDRIERAPAPDADARDDVVVAAALERDLRLQLFDASDPPAIRIVHDAADEIVQ